MDEIVNHDLRDEQTIVNSFNGFSSDPQWLHCQAKLFQEIGMDAYFDYLFKVLNRLAKGNAENPLVKETEKGHCQEIGPFCYFPELLAKCKRKHLI